MVSGEAGAGKSTLVGRGGACGLRCWRVRAVRALRGGPGGARISSSPKPSATSSSTPPDDRLAVSMDGVGAGLARLLPELSKRLPELGSSKALDADTERYQLHAAVVDLIATVSRISRW